MFKCKDCLGGCQLRCQACIVKSHHDAPLHRIEVSLLFSLQKSDDLFIYLSDGQGSFLIRIPSKTLDSVYNLDTAEVLALVRPLARQIS